MQIKNHKLQPGDFVTGVDQSYPRSIYEVVDRDYTRLLLSFRSFNHAKSIIQVPLKDYEYSESTNTVLLWSVPIGFYRPATETELITQGMTLETPKSYKQVVNLVNENKSQIIHISLEEDYAAEINSLWRSLRNTDIAVWRFNTKVTNLRYVYNEICDDPSKSSELKLVESLLRSKGITEDYDNNVENYQLRLSESYFESPSNCERCKDWQRLSISDSCPDCDRVGYEKAIETLKNKVSCTKCMDIKFITVDTENDYLVEPCKCNMEYRRSLTWVVNRE